MRPVRESCLRLMGENSLDVLEIDAASNNGVDEIRDLRESVKYPPQYGKYKVYIIDEVHMLSASAFNALLKTLRQPTGPRGVHSRHYRTPTVACHHPLPVPALRLRPYSCPTDLWAGCRKRFRAPEARQQIRHCT